MPAALFTLLAVLVAAGAFTWLDQAAVDHLMPGLDRGAGSWGGGGIGTIRVSEALLPGFNAPRHGDATIAAVTYAIVVLASVLPSVLLAGGALAVLARRGQRALAATLGSAFVAANLAEVVSKLSLVRPGLHTVGPADALPRILPFDQSYPSGHALRAALLAACVCAVWRRARGPLVTWALAVPAMLVVGGWHTPTDVVGGTLLAVAFTAAAAAFAPWVATRWPRLLGDRQPGGAAGKAPDRAAPGGEVPS